MHNLKHLLLINTAMTFAYFLGGYAGTQLAVPPSNASPIWPAAGIALAGMMVYGRSILPGIFFGTLLAQMFSFLDMSTLDKTFTSLGVGIVASIGSSLQAIVGSELIARFVGKKDPLIEDHHIFRFMLIGGPISCVISATIGTAMLYFRHILDQKDFLYAWAIWWSGDVIGVAIFTPLLLLFIGQPKQSWISRRRFVAYPMIAVILMVVVIFQYNLRQEQTRIATLFDRQVNVMNAAIASQLDLQSKINQSLKAFFDSSNHVDKEEFQSYARSLINNYPGIKTLAWIPRISASQREKFQNQTKFNIHGSSNTQTAYKSEGQDAYPIFFLEPAQGNEGGFGFDIGSDPEALHLINRIIAHAETLMTNRIDFIQDRTHNGNLAVYSPIFEKHQSLDSIEQRNRHFLGFVVNGFDLNDELTLVFNSLKDVQLYIKIWNGSELLYNNEPKGYGQQLNYIHLSKTEQIKSIGHTWTLQYQPSSDFLYNQQSHTIWWLLLGGFLMCALTGLGLLLLTGRTARVEELVHLKTRDLRLTNEKLNSEITKRHQLQLEQEYRNAALEALANGRSLEHILNMIARNAELLYPEMLCSIMLMDNRENCLRYFAAPSLPELFKEALEGQSLNPSENSCSASAFYKRTLIVSDMWTDPFWQNYKSLLLNTDLRACWSEPIVASDGRLFGVFANYYREIREPQNSDLSFMKNMAQLIAITIERKQVEAALNENQRILQNAQEVASIGHYIIDLEASTWQSSPIVDSIFGIDVRFAKTIENLLRLMDSEFTPIMAEILSDVAHPFDRFEQVFKIIRPCDREERWISILGRYDYDIMGKPLHILGTVQDITERKTTDLELERHRIHLQEMVNERTQDYIRAKEYAENANRAKSLFLSNMSHELRTPMHAILSFGKLGLGKSQQTDCAIEKLNHYFDCIVKSSERLMPLINDLLDLSKLETEKSYFALSTHNLRQLILLIYAEISDLAEQKNINFNLEGVPANMILECEGSKMGQVLRNLFTNAIKFSPEYSQIKLVASYAELKGRRTEDQLMRTAVALDIIDEGIGIPENELETIFDEFVQSSKTRTSAGGTGLGLAICREIVKRHGGTIHAFNNEHKGCRFTIILPLSSDLEIT